MPQPEQWVRGAHQGERGAGGGGFFLRFLREFMVRTEAEAETSKGRVGR